MSLSRDFPKSKIFLKKGIYNKSSKNIKSCTSSRPPLSNCYYREYLLMINAVQNGKKKLARSEKMRYPRAWEV